MLDRRAVEFKKENMMKLSKSEKAMKWLAFASMVFHAVIIVNCFAGIAILILGF